MAKKRYNSRTITGVHFLGELYDCRPEVLGSLKVPDMRQRVSSLVKRAGFKELGRFYFRFPGGGMTGTVTLSESHIAFHTWPEYGYATLDVYTCNYRRNNLKRTSTLFKRLASLFGPSDIKIHRLFR
jgi:S-adenosylmethionine decarboxylase proenzyme